ncbi:TetR/AcrR family transcriptional regulator [Sphingomonas sp. So64.6b]|nr:TetR/AcrR family transcriptional regulator [Sphingomonas sp. So64.6b]
MTLRKPPLSRRDELITQAQVLFFTQGYDGTTVSDIVQAANVSNGAFFHHFATKEALLEAMSETLAYQSAKELEKSIQDRRLGAVERLNILLAHARGQKKAAASTHQAVFEAVFWKNNAVLYDRIATAAIAVFAPVLAKLLADGVAEGSFHVSDPDITAEMILQLAFVTRGAFTQIAREDTREGQQRAAEQLAIRLQHFGVVVDRILGLPDGTLRLTHDGYALDLAQSRKGRARRRRAEHYLGGKSK